MSYRQGQFKNQGKDVGSLRKARADQALSLRKEKRDDNCAKRRMEASDNEMMCDSIKSHATGRKIDLFGINEIARDLKSHDQDKMLAAAVTARTLLTISQNPPVGDFISSGIVNSLLYCVQMPNPELQFEAAWTLTNVASGASIYTCALVEAGAVSVFVNLLRTPMESKLCEQIIWALGNIVGDGPKLRDICIQSGMVEPLLNLVRPGTVISCLRHIAWVLVNICRNKHQPPAYDVVEQLLPVISRLMENDDGEILIDCCWALAYLTDSAEPFIQLVINAGLVEKLVPLMGHIQPKIKVAALRAVGCIITGGDQQTQIVLDMGALTHISSIMLYPKHETFKDALWFISNVAVGTNEQLEMLMQCDIVRHITSNIEGADFLVKKEAVWALTSIIDNAHAWHIWQLYDCGAIPAFLGLLKLQDVFVLQMVLGSIGNMLWKGNERTWEMVQQVESCGGLELIERLQDHELGDVNTLAYEIIENFFSDFDANLGNDKNLKMETTVTSSVPSAGFSFT